MEIKVSLEDLGFEEYLTYNGFKDFRRHVEGTIDTDYIIIDTSEKSFKAYTHDETRTRPLSINGTLYKAIEREWL